jgi:lipopolysaccharide/colanic/teichoic acid biosynthesis glycosyltransferase
MIAETLLLTQNTNTNLYFYAKRLMDIILASILLFLLLPLLAVVAIAIKLDSAGPIIFVHKRVGSRRRVVNGIAIWDVHDFNFYKFRSMRADNDEHEHKEHIKAYVSGELAVDENDPTTFKAANDDRITRVGHILRATSIDELPQLINVIKGDMSLVGPRPVPTYEFEQYAPAHYERMTAMQGITGLWQVSGRCAVTFEEQIQLDIEYARNQSILMDLKLLFMTVPAVITKQGAG